jgi:hypothetical protein
VRRQSRTAARMAINVEAGVTKRMRLNSQCINHIRISGNHNWRPYLLRDCDSPRVMRIVAIEISEERTGVADCNHDRRNLRRVLVAGRRPPARLPGRR